MLTASQAWVQQLAKEGENLALHYHSQKSKDESIKLRDDLLRAYPGILISLHTGDLGTTAAVEQLFVDAIKQHKKVDIVVNTAGMVLKKPISKVSEDHDKMFAYAVFVDEQRRRAVEQLRVEAGRRQGCST